MKEKGTLGGLLAAIAVIALLSAALGGAYSLSEKTWNESWSLETLENNVDFVADAVLFEWDGGAWDNHSTDNLPTDNCAADNASNSGFWDTHSLDAVPVVQENASVEDLPTAEEVENILFEWDVFENKRPPVIGNWTGSLDLVIDMMDRFDLEYHFDGSGDLHVDTPGWVYKTPAERDDNEYMIGNFVMENGGGSRNALDFCRHLKKQGIANGIAITRAEGYYPGANVLVPVKSGLMYLSQGEGKYLMNRKPGRSDSWLEDDLPVTSIALHWRLGEGDYVSWLYTLENGKPTMIWPENDQPVGWRTST